MADYEETKQYLKDMAKPGNTVLGVNHDDVPKFFPMKQADDESMLWFGLKGLAAGGVAGAVAGKVAQASQFGVPGKDMYAMSLGAGVGASAGLARNLVEYGRRKRERATEAITNKKEKKG